MLEKLKQSFPILLLTAGHGAVDLYIGLLAVVAPGLSVYLDIPLGDLIMLAGAVTLLSNISQMFVGFCMDRRNLSLLLWVGVVLSALPAFMGLAPGYYSLAALVLLGSIGTGIYHPEAALAAHDASGEKAYLGIPLFMAGGSCVYAVGTPVAIAIAERWGFPALTMLAPPGLLVGAIFLAQYRHRRKTHPSLVLRARSKRVTKKQAGVMSFWPLLAVAICYGVANGLFIAILSSHYELLFGPSARYWAGWVLMLFGVSASLCSFGWSALAKRHGFYQIAIASQLIACPLFLLMAAPSSPVIGFLIAIPLSVFSPSAVYPLAVARARNAAGLTQGMRTSIVMGGTSGLSALTVMGAGVILRRGFPSSHVLVFIAACSAVSVLLGVWQVLAAKRNR